MMNSRISGRNCTQETLGQLWRCTNTCLQQEQNFTALVSGFFDVDLMNFFFLQMTVSCSACILLFHIVFYKILYSDVNTLCFSGK